MKIVSPNGNEYQVGKRLGGNSRFTLYACSSEEKKDTLILKISTLKKFNSDVDREAFLLGELYNEAQLTEEAFAKEKEEGNDTFLNYHFFFPLLIESFVSIDNGSRTVSVIDFSHICTKLVELVPISHIIKKQRLSVDPRTSAWILGKLLKLLDFVHSQEISVGNISIGNILINRDEHYVLIFDWSNATIQVSGLSDDTKTEEIASATKSVLKLLGSKNDGSLLKSSQIPDDRYELLLKSFALGDKSNALEAKDEFYSLIRNMWPREFYPYTTVK